MSSFADVVSTFYPSSSSPAVGTAGLFVSGSDAAVPLRIRTVNSKVHCDTSFADTTETFAFISDEDVSVVFKFPLPSRSAVYRLEASIGDRTITTEVKPKQEAQAQFDTAVQQGHTAVIAKQEASTQIFTLELGNLEAMQEAIVNISYLRVLDSVGGALEWVHTATWRPPYLGSAGDRQRGAAAAGEQNPRFASHVAYSLAYDIQLFSSRGFKAVESPEAVTICEAAKGGVKRVTMSEEVSDPSKDLTLLIELNPPDSGKHAVSTADGYGQVSLQRCSRPGPAGSPPRTKTIALATFVPQTLHSARAGDAPPPPLNLELVLIVDGSGSMEGSAIAQARESALYFIKDLPTGRGIKFNIVVFGSSHVSWSSACQEFTADSMKSAVDWVQANVHANWGGTEILGTFQSVYAVPVTPGYTRQIIFMTDGGISSGEEAAVFELVSGRQARATEMSQQLKSGIQQLKAKVLGNSFGQGTRAAPSPASLPAVLCLGIGHGVHRGLLDGLASRTGGVSQYVVDGESITRKAGLLSKAALGGPSTVCDARLVLSTGVGRAVPHVLPPRLFVDQPLHMLVELDPDQPATSLKLQGKRADGTNWELDMPLDNASVEKGDAYHVLHAMCYVSGLLDGSSHLHVSPDGTPLPRPPAPDDVKASVVSAAVAAHLVTRHTAAVGVMTHRDPMDPTKVKQVNVPLAVPHGAEHFANNASNNHNATLYAMPASFARGGGGAVLSGLMRRAAVAPKQCMTLCAPPAPSNGGCFGGAPALQPFASGFGGAPASQASGAFLVAAPALGGLFGAAPAPQPPGALFADASASQASTGLFGASPAPALFGWSVPWSGASPAITGGVGGFTPSDIPRGPAFGSLSSTPGPGFGSISAQDAFSASNPAFRSVPFGFSPAPAAVGYPGAAFCGAGVRFRAAPPPAPAPGGPAPFSAPMAQQSAPYGNTQHFALSARVCETESNLAPVEKKVSQEDEDEAYDKCDMAVEADVCSAVDKKPMLKAEILQSLSKGAAQSGDESPAALTGPKMSPGDVLALLNLSRGVEGNWSDSEEVMRAVTSQVPGEARAPEAGPRAGRPAELTGQQWATVLALAFLRKHCAAERSAWEGMEAKALAWLSAGWPPGARAPGLTVLAALKLV